MIRPAHSTSPRGTPVEGALDALLLAPATIFALTVWFAHYRGGASIAVVGACHVAAADLLFVMAGWRTAPLARTADPPSTLRLLRAGAVRFLPLHLVAFAISAACSLEFRHRGLSRIATTPSTDLLSAAANLFMVHGWFPAETFLGLWSPYLWIFGAGLLWLQSASGIVRLLARGLERLSPWILGGILWTSGVVCLGAPHAFLPERIFDTTSSTWIAMSPLPRLWEFALGALFRLAWEGASPRSEGWWIPSRWPTALAGLVLVPVLAGSLVLARAPVDARLLFLPLLAAPLAGGLLVILREPDRPLPAFLGTAGRASVGIFLLSPWSFWIAVASHRVLPWIVLPVLYPAVAIGMGLLAQALQIPLHRLLDRKWPRPAEESDVSPCGT